MILLAQQLVFPRSELSGTRMAFDGGMNQNSTRWDRVDEVGLVLAMRDERRAGRMVSHSVVFFHRGSTEASGTIG